MVSDDAKLAAQLSTTMVAPNSYLPVVDGPRLQRPDADAEVTRRNNAAARVNPDVIVLAGLPRESVAAFNGRFPARKTVSVTSEDIPQIFRAAGFAVPRLRWGRDRIGLGLLTALRNRSAIEFTDAPSPHDPIIGRSNHLVVCEQGEDLSEVIAANYAYSLNATLCLIPAVAPEIADHLLEHFYNLYEDRQRSQSEVLEDLKTTLRSLCGPIAIPAGGSITFITGGLPFGFAYPEVPTTHLFKYPDLGISVINGFAAEESTRPPVEVAILVDPETTEAPEIAAAARALRGRHIFVRGYVGKAANVRDVQNAIELFPYDLLVIATHCGDAPGYRWTYEFKDSEGIERVLVVDLAIGIARTDDPEMFQVTQFERFVSLDGVDWNDPDKKEKLYIGSAMLDFMTLAHEERSLEPIKKESIDRVVGSAVLKMSDNNYVPLPRALACQGTPIVINNACASWHRLAKTFTFGNARSYVGTLFMVSNIEASEVVTRVLERHFGRFLPHAVWAAQREVYRSSVRRPYVVTGVYPQRLHGSPRDVPLEIARKLRAALREWEQMLANASPDEKVTNPIAETVSFYRTELKTFLKRWKLRI